jgi:hypothetical protein
MMGAVHFGAPDDEKQRAFAEIRNQFGVGGYRAPYGS